MKYFAFVFIYLLLLFSSVCKAILAMSGKYSFTRLFKDKFPEGEFWSDMESLREWSSALVKGEVNILNL